MRRENGRTTFERVAGSEFEMEVDLVLLAMGFLGPERPGLLTELGVRLTDRGNVWRDENWMTSVPSVFTAGDMQRGQSLIVWAIAEGRSAARGHRRLADGNIRPAGARLRFPPPGGAQRRRRFERAPRPISTGSSPHSCWHVL